MEGGWIQGFLLGLLIGYCVATTAYCAATLWTFRKKGSEPGHF